MSLLLLGEAKRKVPGHDESGGGEAGLDDHQHHHHHQLDPPNHQHHHHLHDQDIGIAFQASLGSQYVLSAPPLKSTKKLVKEVKRILTGESKEKLI